MRMIICDDAEFSLTVARDIVQHALRRIDQNGRFTLVLSGGKTPGNIFDQLVTDISAPLDWKNVFIFWVDERCVSPQDPESNFKLAYERLISKANVGGFYRIQGEIQPKIAAEQYEQNIKEFFGLKPNQIPRFDYFLLGVGQDGHIASLFDVEAINSSSNRLVSSFYVNASSTHRVSLTLAVINAGRRIVMMACGQQKAKVVRRAIRHKDMTLPVAHLTDQAQWFVDKAFASTYNLEKT